MSEKIYSLLLRLYPARFRAVYGEAALQLVRDRARDEKGLSQRMRLWIDLLFDLLLSVPYLYRQLGPALVSSSAQQRLESTTTFHVLEGEAPAASELLYGGMLSLAAFALVAISLLHGADSRPPRTLRTEALGPRTARVSARMRSAEDPLESTMEYAIASGALETPTIGRMRVSTDQHGYRSALSPLLGVQGSRRSQIPQLNPQTDHNTILDAAERQRVIDTVIANLKQYYVNPDAGLNIGNALLAHEKSGDDDRAMDSATLADLITTQMREASHDMRLDLLYSERKLPEHPMEPTAEELALYRKEMEHTNCTFEKVAILPHNIGYLKINSFPEPSLCRQIVVAAMSSLNHADAIIFDLRDNTGGSPEMVSLIIRYLFDHPTYIYSPRANTTLESWTSSPVPDNQLADKRVYVVTSSMTSSAAEQFCYNLKMLKRATLVGETTRGSAHAGVFHRIDDHFGMGIPDTNGINPYSDPGWEGTGVEPDVKVRAKDAMETAQQLAETEPQNN